MAHPPSGGPVAADVRKAPLVVAIWGAEGDFLYRLVHQQTLRNKPLKYNILNIQYTEYTDIQYTDI